MPTHRLTIKYPWAITLNQVINDLENKATLFRDPPYSNLGNGVLTRGVSITLDVDIPEGQEDPIQTLGRLGKVFENGKATS